MKKWIVILPLCLLTGVALCSSMMVHKYAWLVNCLPLLIWTVAVAAGQYRWPALGDPAAIIFGILYGAFAGAGAAAFLSSAMLVMLANRYDRHPYDSAAYAIILLLSLMMFLALAIIDYTKFRWHPLWVRIVSALVTFLPCMLTALNLMAYFEGVLSRYVS